MALAPIIGDGISKDLSVFVESGLCDWLLASLAGLQLGARVLVPESPSAVGTHRCQSPVDRVKRDVVDGIDVLDSLRKENSRILLK